MRLNIRKIILLIYILLLSISEACILLYLAGISMAKVFMASTAIGVGSILYTETRDVSRDNHKLILSIILLLLGLALLQLP